jgi:hypothetical protein
MTHPKRPRDPNQLAKQRALRARCGGCGYAWNRVTVQMPSCVTVRATDETALATK